VRRVAVVLATGFGIGYLPVAPATWASAATALGLAVLLPRIGFLPLLGATIGVTLAALAVSGPAERSLGHDAHPIVADEVAGMFVAVCGVPAIGHATPPLAITLVLAFALFRLFDIAKPFPVYQSQRLPGAFGVVVDDLLAGLYTNAALQLLARLWPAH
jgi:phosphatidylglycerophosphatase A